MRATCDAIKCDRAATYYAVERDGQADGFFCYWHYPAGWIVEAV